MSNLHQYYTHFLASLNDVEPRDNFIRQSRTSKFSDKALIVLSLASEAAGINSGLNLFRQLPPEAKGKIERSVYNKRRRNLAHHTQRLQKLIANEIIPSEDYYLVDNMPIEVCKMSRAKLSCICTENAPDFGYCAAQKLYYFGYKIHAVCT